MKKTKLIYLEKLISPTIVGVYFFICLSAPNALILVMYPRSKLFFVFWLGLPLLILYRWYQYKKSPIKCSGFDKFLLEKDINNKPIRSIRSSSFRKTIVAFSVIFFLWLMYLAFKEQLRGNLGKLGMDILILASVCFNIGIQPFTFNWKKQIIRSEKAIHIGEI